MPEVLRPQQFAIVVNIGSDTRWLLASSLLDVAIAVATALTAEDIALRNRSLTVVFTA